MAGGVGMVTGVEHACRHEGGDVLNAVTVQGKVGTWQAEGEWRE